MTRFVKTRFEVGETAVTVAADERYVDAAVSGIVDAREEIRRRISKDRFFLTTFEPYDLDDEIDGVVRGMCDAARAAGVGPMATVAGAIAQAAVEAMAERGCDHCWVDNGGDIALLLSSPVTVEVFGGPGSDAAYGFEVGPEDRVRGICSSSGAMGHSISLGQCDVSTVLADSATLADAYATAIGNGVRTARDLETCFDGFSASPGFIGGLAALAGEVAICGDFPDIVEVAHSPQSVTAHSSMSSSRYLGDPAAHQGRRKVMV